MDALSWRGTDRSARLRHLVRGGHVRKLLLYSAACCRRIWQWLDGSCREAVAVTERHADGQATQRELAEAMRHVEASVNNHTPAIEGRIVPQTSWCAARAVLLSLAGFADEAAEQAAFAASSTVPHAAPGTRSWAIAFVAACRRERRWQKRLVDEVFGDPYRPVTTVDPAWSIWNNGAVHRLAETFYAERTLHQVPVLADALEDAGCGDAELLTHLRGPGPHVRGCWAVDLLLGKL